MLENQKNHQDKVLGNHERITIMNTTVDVLDMKQTINLVELYTMKKEPLHLVGVNADKMNEINQNQRLKEIINHCGIINADGASVIIASKFLRKRLPERVAGIDLMLNLIALSEKKAYKVFLLGAKQEVVEKVGVVLRKKHPNLKLVGIHNGYFEKAEWSGISHLIKQAQPDFVFVGITSPMKEYLIEFLQNDGNTSVFMGAGGSFDVISGDIPRAPLWVQKVNLEWLFRVIQEPRRLFKRYFIGNFIFIKNMIKEKWQENDDKTK